MRGIEVFANSSVRDVGEEGIKLSPGDRVIGPAEVIALPVMEGPAIDGLPSDEHGFIPIDDHARVKGLDGVYAAGDGTTFPIKQGGLAAQQADAAAEHIAYTLGAAGSPEPFRPVLRGKLLTGDESLQLRSAVAGGGGEDIASPDVLWWPPHKISARYLAPFLYHGEAHEEQEPPRRGSMSRWRCRRSGTRSRWRSIRSNRRVSIEGGARARPRPRGPRSGEGGIRTHEAV